jgi:hypothetical protein
MGGSDQWGNIVNGIELGRRVDDFELFGVTCPLITTADGAKMGKTASGAVWLNEDMLCLPMTTGSSGATRTTPTSAASCGCSPTCRSTRSPGWNAAGRGDQRGEEGAGHRGHGAMLPTAGRVDAATPPPRRRGAPSRRLSPE